MRARLAAARLFAAIAMAKAEQAHGRYCQAVALARTIRADQTVRIRAMTSLLQR